MRGARMGGPQRCHQGLRLRAARAGLHAADEAALAHQQLAVRGGGQGLGHQRAMVRPAVVHLASLQFMEQARCST